MKSAEKRLMAEERRPRKNRNFEGSRSCEGVRKGERVEKEERMREERPMSESGTERDNVGCVGNDRDARGISAACRDGHRDYVPHVREAK
jgi:hypothetical protein